LHQKKIGNYSLFEGRRDDGKVLLADRGARAIGADRQPIRET